MANFNKVILLGNVTRDLDLKHTPKGTALVSFGLAVNRRYSDASGETKEDTTFVDVEAWGRTAEIVHQYSGKGQSLFVEGRLKLDTWDDRATGEKRSRLKVVAENVQLMGRKNPNAPQSASHQNSPSPSHSRPTPAPSDAGSDMDDDLPF